MNELTTASELGDEIAQLNGLPNIETYALYEAICHDEGQLQYWVLEAEERDDVVSLADALQHQITDDLHEQQPPQFGPMTPLLLEALPRIHWEELASKIMDHMTPEATGHLQD